MKNLAENNVVRFVGITKKKEGYFAKFKVQGIRGGMEFSSSITVDIAAVDVDISEDSLETIIETSAKTALREFKKAELQFEGMETF